MENKIKNLLIDIQNNADSDDMDIEDLNYYYQSRVERINFSYTNNLETVKYLLNKLEFLNHEINLIFRETCHYFICDLLLNFIKKLTDEDFIKIWNDLMSIVLTSMINLNISNDNCRSSIRLFEWILLRLETTENLDDFIKYFDSLLGQLLKISDTICTEDKESWELLMTLTDLLQRIVFKFGVKISLEQFDSIIQSFCKAYENLKENDGYLRLILETFNSFFDDYERNHRWSEPIFIIFNKCFRIEKNQFDDSSDYLLIKSLCLNFFSKLCKINISLVYSIRFELIDYLSSVYNITEKMDEDQYEKDILVQSSLELIECMIKNWNNQIYNSLDTEGINRLINNFKPTELSDENDEIQQISYNIFSSIEKFKSSLRKFYIVNGYTKMLQ